MKSFAEYIAEQEQLNETMFNSWDAFIENGPSSHWSTVYVSKQEFDQAVNYYDLEFARGIQKSRFAGIIKPKKSVPGFYSLETLTPEEKKEFGEDVYRAWSVTHNTPIAMYKLDFGSYRIRELDMEGYGETSAVKWSRPYKPVTLVLLQKK